MLAVSGQLDTTPPIGSVVARAGEGPATGSAARRARRTSNQAINDPRNTHRSVYLPIVRDNLPEALALFDAPTRASIVADRPTTTVPSQGLFLLNNPFVLACRRCRRRQALEGHDDRHGADPGARICSFYGRAAGREGTGRRREVPEAVHGAQLAKDRVPPTRQERETWSAFCQASVRQCGVSVSEVEQAVTCTMRR